MNIGKVLSGSGIGAGVGLLAGGLPGMVIGAGLGGLNGYQTDAENRANQKAVDSANAQNVEFWNMQNIYNSPVEQMARLKAAGLNPMLVYGSGNVTGNSSSSIASSQVAHRNAINTMAGIQGIQALSNLRNTNANTSSTQANTLATYQDIKNMQTGNAIQQAQLEQERQNVELGAMDLEVARAVQGTRVENARRRAKVESGELGHEEFQNSGTFFGNVAKFLGGSIASVGRAVDVAGRVSRRDPVYVRNYTYQRK